MEDDLLDRQRLAKDIYSVVSGTPDNWSCRIGVFGKWGQGKTSLLRLVEAQASRDGLISFWINPSQANDMDGLWRIVLEAFIDSLDREDLLLEEVRAWRIRLLADKSEPVDKLAELNRYSKALVGFGRAAIKEWLRPDGEQIKRIREKLHSKSILVFIDDLDRTSPSLVPALLLGLRDVLDLPGFCFLVAFDEDIISDTLKRVNPPWGDGRAFIDKIIDFSFSLPETTAFQRLKLLKSCIRELCPWMNLDVIDQNSDLLPESPRKLKALLRNLMTLRALVERHDPAEIQWTDLLFGQLIRLESPSFMERFLTDSGNEGLVQVGKFLSRKNGAPPFEDRLKEAIGKSGIDDTVVRSRLESILAEWGSRRLGESGRHFGYYAGFGTIHRDITQGEFEALANGYAKSRDLEELGRQLRDHASRVSSLESDVAREFMRLLAEARGACLEEAADREMESDVLLLVEQASKYLGTIRETVEQPRSFFDIGNDQRRNIAMRLVGQALQWIHFDRSPYLQSRQEEREFLKALASSSYISGLDWIEMLTPWQDQTLYFSGAAAAMGQQLIDEIMEVVRERVVQEAIDSFAQQGSVLDFYGPKATRVVRFCFLEAGSPLWSEPGLTRFLDLLASAGRDATIRRNCQELMRCLSWSVDRPGFGGNREEMSRILNMPGVAGALWAATISRTVSYRFQLRLLEMRTTILNQGVGADQLPIPDWLMNRAMELSAESRLADRTAPSLGA